MLSCDDAIISIIIPLLCVLKCSLLPIKEDVLQAEHDVMEQGIIQGDYTQPSLISAQRGFGDKEFFSLNNAVLHCTLFSFNNAILQSSFFSFNNAILHSSFFSFNIEILHCRFFSLNTTILHCRFFSLNTAISHCRFFSLNISILHCRYFSLNIAILHCWFFSLNTAVLHCRFFSLNTAILNCRFFSLNTAILHCRFFSINTAIHCIVKQTEFNLRERETTSKCDTLLNPVDVGEEAEPSSAPAAAEQPPPSVTRPAPNPDEVEGYIGGLSTALQNAVDKPLMLVLNYLFP
ncbi:unnamed protein product [Ranitomeya imitator]|uniref:Uncharacterized protein n=1 Tax=Ranitomeya imitator TaxID=111125 RepID=A0ABN9LA38_9NEOB|nr:unnamed protein product [Ranitomeya imitator]